MTEKIVNFTLKCFKTDKPLEANYKGIRRT